MDAVSSAQIFSDAPQTSPVPCFLLQSESSLSEQEICIILQFIRLNKLNISIKSYSGFAKMSFCSAPVVQLGLVSACGTMRTSAYFSGERRE